MCQRNINGRNASISTREGCNALKVGQISEGCYVHKERDTGGGEIRQRECM